MRSRLSVTRATLKRRGFDPAIAPAIRQIIETRHEIRAIKNLIGKFEEITK
jgi:hypothetical protein